jgi:hypothetical protein
MCYITLKRSLINDIREATKASAKSLSVFFLTTQSLVFLWVWVHLHAPITLAADFRVHSGLVQVAI